MPELLDRFCQIASPYLEVFPPNSCIEQTRILAECLGSFGVPVEVVESMFYLHCPKLSVAYLSGATAEERARGKATVKEWIDRTTPAHEGHGHVLAFVMEDQGWYLVDPTISQASMPDRGMVIERHILAVGPLERKPESGEELRAGMVLESGLEIDVRWRFSGTRRFESTAAWEPSHLWPLILRIIREMKWAATVEARRKEANVVQS